MRQPNKRFIQYILLIGLVFTFNNLVASGDISGTIFEDINYGGGAGRDLMTSSGAGINGVRVELYTDNAGAFEFVSATTTATGTGDGEYSFTGLVDNDYRIRVVNNATDDVLSTRTGAGSGERLIQTYRTDASTGTAVAEGGEVGGLDPSQTDDAVSVTVVGTVLAEGGVQGGTDDALTWSPVTLSGSNVTDVDFGFNASTIVNVNETGLGSFRQFLTNNNLLTDNSSLAQSGSYIDNDGIPQNLPAGFETSIFMISDGSGSDAGMDTAPNLLTSNIALIPVTSSLLPILNVGDVRIDGSTQEANAGDNNSGYFGTDIDVGTGADGIENTGDEPHLNQTRAPEVEIAKLSSIQVSNSGGVLIVDVDDVTINGLALHGSYRSGASTSSGDINTRSTLPLITIDNLTVGNNLLGVTALMQRPIVTERSNAGIVFFDEVNITNVTIENNIINYTEKQPIVIQSGADQVTIYNNEFLNAGMDASPNTTLQLYTVVSGFGMNTVILESNYMSITESRSSITFQRNAGFNILGGGYTNGPITIINNTVEHMGLSGFEFNITGGNNASGSLQGAITQNVFRDNGEIVTTNNRGSGVNLNAGNSRFTIRRNAIYDNRLLGIGLANQNRTNFVSVNDNGDGDSGANEQINFPVIDSILLSGGIYIIAGYAPSGSTVDVYLADITSGGSDGTTASNIFAPQVLPYGEGEVYVTTFIENGAGDNNTTDTGTYSVDGNSETNQNRFSVDIPLGSIILPGGSGIVLDENTLFTMTATDGIGNTSEFGPVLYRDFGDAPDSYLTSLDVNGPYHGLGNFLAGLNASGTTTLMLGSVVDREFDGQPSTGATDDSDDEDGITWPVLNPSTLYNETITLTNTTGANAYLNVWIDYNADGDFLDAGEQITTDQVVASGATTATLSFTTPAGISGTTYARIRLCGSAAECNTVGGAASDGEVEDYGNVVLPVELSNFEVEATKAGVLVKWTTESETENLGFILERRVVNGGVVSAFEEIATYTTNAALAGQGSTPSATDYEYLDALVEASTTYEYRLADVDYNNTVTYHATRTVTVTSSPSTREVPDEFTVKEAYPNPFNPSTTIEYALPVIASGAPQTGQAQQSQVQLQIYDITGKLINTLIDQVQPSGWHSVQWNGKDQVGANVPAGAYLVRVKAGTDVCHTKVMLLK